MQGPILRLDVPTGTETLLVKSNYKPYYKSIAAITLSYALFFGFMKGQIIYWQLSQPVPDQMLVTALIWSIAGDAFSTFVQLWCWAVGIAVVRNSPVFLKFIVPAVCFSVGNVVSVAIAKALISVATQTNEYSDIPMGVVSSVPFMLNVLIVLLTKLLGFIRNKIAPYIISLMIFSFVYRLYFPEHDLISTSILSKLRIEQHVLQFVCCMVVLRLFNISFYDELHDKQSMVKRLKALLETKVETTGVTRKQIFEEVTSLHPEVPTEKVAHVFTTIPYPDDVRESRIRNALIIFVIVLSCFSTYGIGNSGQFGDFILILKVLLIYFLLRPNPYIYVLLLCVQLITLTIIAFDLIEFVRYSSAYSSYGMDKYRKLLLWTAVKFVAALAFALLVWNVLRFRYPSFRLFKAGKDEDGNLLL